MRPDDTPLKTCTKCGVEKPRTAEFFYVRSSTADGLAYACKPCSRKDPAKAAEDWRRWAERHPEEARERQRRYRLSHSSERAELNRQWRLLHAEHRAAYKRSYNATHQEQNSASHHSWQERNRDHVRAEVRNRSALLRGASGTHTALDVAAQRSRQRGLCYWCGEKVGRHYHVDHVMPLALGGSNGPENIVIACAPCNLSKNAKHPMDWAGCMF